MTNLFNALSDPRLFVTPIDPDHVASVTSLCPLMSICRRSVRRRLSVGRSVCHNFLKGQEVILTLHALIGALVLYLGLLDDCVSIHEIYRASAQVML